MTKRKFEQPISVLVSNNTNVDYFNELNCDSIKIRNNRIIFNSIVSTVTIAKLFEFIKIIIESPGLQYSGNRIYLHIISKGGTLNALNDFIQIKNNSFPHIEFISIIENSSIDAGFMLAALCDYRFIKKNVICYMSLLDFNSKYWGVYHQGENQLIDFEHIISNSKYKISREKMLKYLPQNNN